MVRTENPSGTRSVGGTGSRPIRSNHHALLSARPQLHVGTAEEFLVASKVGSNVKSCLPAGGASGGSGVFAAGRFVESQTVARSLRQQGVPVLELDGRLEEVVV